MSKNVSCNHSRGRTVRTGGTLLLIFRAGGVDADADRRGQRAAAAHGWTRARTRLPPDAAPTEPDEMQGMLRVYKLRPVALTLTDSSGNHAALSVSYGADQSCGAAKLGIRLPQCGEPTDKPAETFTVAVKNGGGLLPKGKLEVWRDGDALRFFRRDKGLYTGKGSLQMGELPVRSIRSVKAAGEVRREAYQVHGTEGGLMTGRAIAIGSALALVFGLFGTLLLNIVGLVIGIVIGIIVGIQTSLQEGEPDRTEYREVDERSTAVEIDAPTGGAQPCSLNRRQWKASLNC